MIISYDFGHGCGQDRGANGIVNEELTIRAYAPFAVASLIRAGHTLVNCTPTSANTLQESLSYRTEHANASKSQLHLCFHVNAFQHTDAPMGCEIEVASDNGAKYGQSVLNEIVKLGFKNRGIKRPDLYVTKNTNMPAILIEPFFCDSIADCKLYNASMLGNAIAKGIFDIIGGTTPPVVKSVVKVVYRVVTGSFTSESNADAHIAELKAKGFESFKVIV